MIRERVRLKKCVGITGSIMLIMLTVIACVDDTAATEQQIKYYQVKCERMEQGFYKPWLEFKADTFYVNNYGTYYGNYTQEAGFRNYVIVATEAAALTCIAEEIIEVIPVEPESSIKE